MLAALLLAVAVSSAGPPVPDGSCLESIWRKFPTPVDREFDVTHDNLPNGLFVSCHWFATPFALNTALTDLQAALRARDPDAIAEQSGGRISYIDGEGRRLRLSRAEFARRFNSIFDTQFSASILQLTFADIEINTGSGWNAYVMRGFVHWSSVVDGDRYVVRLTLVDERAKTRRAPRHDQ